MSISVIGTLVPSASGSFPVVDSDDVTGGSRSVADIAGRDAIPAAILRAGSLVYVVATGFAYRYMPNGSWLPDNIRASGMAYSSGFAITGSLVVPHNMGYYPNITVIDGAGDRIFGDIVYNSVHSLTLNFNQPIAGTAYLS